MNHDDYDKRVYYSSQKRKILTPDRKMPSKQKK